jgi:hypothetical protein
MKRALAIGLCAVRGGEVQQEGRERGWSEEAVLESVVVGVGGEVHSYLLMLNAFFSLAANIIHQQNNQRECAC